MGLSAELMPGGSQGAELEEDVGEARERRWRD